MASVGKQGTGWNPSSQIVPSKSLLSENTQTIKANVQSGVPQGSVLQQTTTTNFLFSTLIQY